MNLVNITGNLTMAQQTLETLESKEETSL